MLSFEIGQREGGFYSERGAATKAPVTKAPDDQFLTILTLYS